MPDLLLSRAPWLAVFALLMAGAVAMLAPAQVTAESGGAALFMTNCVPCHGLRGKGDGPAAIAFKPKPRDLTDEKLMVPMKDQHIFDTIRKGGAAVGKSPLMPAFPALKDAEIKLLVEFVRSLSKHGE